MINSKFVLIIVVCFMLNINTYGQQISMVRDLSEGEFHSHPNSFTVYNNLLYFFSDLSDNPQNRQLWSINTNNEITFIDSIGDYIAVGIEWNFKPQKVIAVFNENLIYTKFSKLISYNESTGPIPILDLPDCNGGWGTCPIYNMFVYDDLLYFMHLSDFYRYDGIGNPVIVNDFCNQSFIHPTEDFNFYEFNGNIFFFLPSQDDKDELWMFDGINRSTKLCDLENMIGRGLNFIEFNNKLYFAFFDTVGYTIWAYDGSSSPMFISRIPADMVHTISKFTLFKNSVYLSLVTPTWETELWRFDSINNPEKVKSFDYVEGVRLECENLAVFNDTLFFSASTEKNGNELWTYDGINEPVLFADINPEHASSNPGNFYEFNNKLYFSANDGVHGNELWVYDPGTTSEIVKNGAIELKVFPNPTNQTINIQLNTQNSKLQTLSIYNVTGKQIVTQKINSAKQTIDVSSFEKGYYIISLTDTNGKLIGSEAIVVY